MNPENKTINTNNANSTPQTHMGSNTPKIIGAIVTLSTIAGIGAWIHEKNEHALDDAIKAERDKMMNNMHANMMLNPDGTPIKNTYTDGTYTAIGNYISPAGTEELDISVTLKDGIIATSTVTGKAKNPVSIKMQGQFKAGFEQVVVGKSIDTLSLSVVNGSSLSPRGFMDALQKIKASAVVKS